MEKQKIMIIDDDLSFLDIASKSFENEGFEVVTAASGKKGLNKLEKEDPDLILLDILMPEMDGWKTCDKIKIRKPDANIIFLTVLDIAPDPKLTGVLCHVKKVNMDEIVTRVKKIIEKA